MIARYEPIVRWNIPRGVMPTTLRGILRAAQQRHEGGAFWLGTRGATAHVRSVVLLEPPGVTEERGFWEASPAVFGVVGDFAARNGQSLLAVVHSHEGLGATWLSDLDRRGGVHVPDILAVVVPGFGQVRDPRRWSVHQFDGRGFVEWGLAQYDDQIEWTDATVVAVRASADGVRDA